MPGKNRYMPSPEEIRRETVVIRPRDDKYYGEEVRHINEKVVVVKIVQIIDEEREAEIRPKNSPPGQ